MLTIRRYEPPDAEAVWNLHILALQQVGAYLGSGAWDDDLRDIEQAYLRNRGEFLVGLDDGRLIAMGALRKTSETLAEIKRMRVHLDFQGCGIGQKMLSRLEQRARELGYMRLHLDTSTKQFAAQHLYQKNGFYETRRGFIKELECIFFEKSLISSHKEL